MSNSEEIKLKKWAFYLTLIVSVFNIALSVISLLLLQKAQERGISYDEEERE